MTERKILCIDAKIPSVENLRECFVSLSVWQCARNGAKMLERLYLHNGIDELESHVHVDTFGRRSYEDLLAASRTFLEKYLSAVDCIFIIGETASAITFLTDVHRRFLHVFGCAENCLPPIMDARMHMIVINRDRHENLLTQMQKFTAHQHKHYFHERMV